MKISDVIIDMHQGINTVADKVEYLDSGIPIIQSKNFTKGYLDLEDVRYLGEEDEKKYIEKYNPHVGDILMANIGTIGKSYVISEEQRFLIAWNAFLIKPNAEKVKSDFLKFYFDYLASTHYFDGLLTGGTVKFINKKKIGDINIPDKSLAEQSEICNVLSQVEKVIIQRQQEMELLDDLIKARFVELFGNPEQNEKGWRTCRLGDECTVINGRAYKAEELLDEGKYRVLRVGNFFTNDSWYYSDLELDNDKYCDEGDLLFAWSASFGPRIWHGEKVIYHYHIWKLIGYENCLNKDFFVELLNYNCDVMKRGTHGSTMLHFTKSQMEDQLLILPPMQLQEQFADFVKQVDKSKLMKIDYMNKTRRFPQ